MRRNCKRESLRLGTVARSVVTCVCVAVIGLAYVWQKNQIYRLGDELKKREATLAAAEKRYTMLAAQLAQLKSPSLLEASCQQYNLGLIAPREVQMVRLYEPGAEWDTRLLPAVAASAKPSNKVVARR
jgi:cell division protein FtsB